MVRNPSIIACCAILLAVPATVAAQSLAEAPSTGQAESLDGVPSFEETVQAALDAERVGLSLSDGGRSFGTGEAPKRRGAFDRQLPDVHLETEAERGIDWWKPTLEIAGATVSPDIKKKGLKVAIPMELIQSGQSLVAGNGPD